MDNVRLGDRPDFLSHQIRQFVVEFCGVFVAAEHKRDEGVDALTLDGVGETDDGRFGDGIVQDQRALDFRGADAVPGHVHDVVDPAGDPVVAVCVAPGSVAREIVALCR